MTIRATQKKIMSKPVTKTDEGKYLSITGLETLGYSGVQSNVENGHKADENHVSSTSLSCCKFFGSMPFSVAIFCASSLS